MHEGSAARRGGEKELTVWWGWLSSGKLQLCRGDEVHARAMVGTCRYSGDAREMEMLF